MALTLCCGAHPVSNNTTASNQVFLTGALCQYFLRHLFVSCRTSNAENPFTVLFMRKLLSILIAFVLPLAIMAPANAASVTGAQGQTLSATVTTAKSGTTISVSGNHFDETVGIYLAFCVVPAKGALPTPCGGGVNKAGLGTSSYWISSNPPPYGVGLAEEFLPGGRFTKKVKISRKIGAFDCMKVKCAITVRADHLRADDRSYDIFLPIKVK